MTIITMSRSRLDSALNKTGTTLFLILDDPGNEAELVREKADEIAGPRPWRSVFLITDPTLLTANERKLWFDEPDLHRGRRAVGQHEIAQRSTHRDDLVLRAARVLERALPFPVAKLG